MAILKQATLYNRDFVLVSNVDHITGKTGATVTALISKNASAFASPVGAVTEIGNGWYYIQVSAFDTNTPGDLAFHMTASGADPTDWCDQVQTQIFPDLALTGGRVSITSSYMKNAAAFLPFVMTVGNPPSATPGLSPIGQRNFGSGWSPIAGPITDLGNGWYFAALAATDTNAAVISYHFSSLTPNANDQDVTIYTQP